MTPDRLTAQEQAAMRTLMEQLVSSDYSEYAETGMIGRCRVDDVRRVIAEYGRTLSIPPKTWFEHARLFQVNGTADVSIDIPVWTLEEGASDLYLIATISNRGEQVLVHLDDVRVP